MPSTNDAGAWTDARILALRPAKNPVDAWRPHAFFVEPERTRQGAIEDVATLLLTNRECPYRCLMCDLWKNTTDQRVPSGAIAAQVAYALDRLPTARHVKLYNAGNFFDAQAIPPGDLPAVAERLAAYRSVIIECHPHLIGPRCLEFQHMLRPELQVAMGLETVQEEVLALLNKRMTVADFDEAVLFLKSEGISTRAFLLLRPPTMSEADGVEWTRRSLDHAFDVGVECCTVIPTRAGNGAMEQLQASGLFAPPSLASLEEATAYGIQQQRGRVFADLWDIERFYTCQDCGPRRGARLRTMNLTQTIPDKVTCTCTEAP
jgi:radical SAM enzyme (TIGR01210 family)